MSFDTGAYLRRATARAKSDVANKLISMLLHEVSRRICSRMDLSVNDPRYGQAVNAIFGSNCYYCGRTLEPDRASVEHLDGMNRFRIGLHIPGNVAVACTRCNREKRRDDAAPKLILGATGWESFLSHDSTRCSAGCKSCDYWREIWPSDVERIEKLNFTRAAIASFRQSYHPYLALHAKAMITLPSKLESIYRDCQVFATDRIKDAVDEVFETIV